MKQSLVLAFLLLVCVFAVPISSAVMFYPSKRECTHSLGDPHVWSHYSTTVLHAEQTCTYNNVWLNLFSSPDISIQAYVVFPTSGLPGSFQKKIKIGFKNGLLTDSYFANDPSVPLSTTFSSGSSSRNGPTGAPWLNIIIYASGSILIQDFHTQSTILILEAFYTEWHFNIYFCTTTKLLQSGTGVLVTGCDPKYVDGPKDVKPLEMCQKVPGSKNIILSQEVAQRICNKEAPIGKEAVVEALTNNVLALDRMTELDQATFQGTKQ